MLEQVFYALLFALPAWFANATPVVLGGGCQLDFGKNWTDGRRIFGKGKTIRGLAAGLFAGTAIGWLEHYLFANYYPSLSFIGSGPILGFVLASGAMFGDLLGSFAKRRLGMESGSEWKGFDQTGFIVFALLFAYLYAPFPLVWALILFVLSPLAHVATNRIGFWLKLKEVPY